MNCPSCHEPVEPGSDLCLSCGEPIGGVAAPRAVARGVATAAPSLAQPSPPARPAATTPVARPAAKRPRRDDDEPVRCPGCGTPNSAESERCRGCGGPVRRER